MTDPASAGVSWETVLLCTKKEQKKKSAFVASDSPQKKKRKKKKERAEKGVGRGVAYRSGDDGASNDRNLVGRSSCDDAGELHSLNFFFFSFFSYVLNTAKNAAGDTKKARKSLTSLSRLRRWYSIHRQEPRMKTPTHCSTA
jgi:hypothetical protein